MPGLNASAHLQSYGWAGPGHPLNPGAYKQRGSRGLAYDPTNPQQHNNHNKSSASSSSSSSYFAAGGNGLIRPLLVSKKSDNLGLGRRAHEPQRGNEWWLKGFEAALASTGNSSREASEGASTPVGTGKAEELQRNINMQAGRFGGLYGFFVRGETVGGTIGVAEEEEEEQGTRRAKKNKKKRKSGLLDGVGDEDEDEDGSGSARDGDGGGEKAKTNNNNNKTTKKRRQDEPAEAEFGQIAAFMSVRDKDARKRAERKRLRESEQLRVAGEWLEMKEGKEKKQLTKNKATRSALNSPPVAPAIIDDDNDGNVPKGTETHAKRKRRAVVGDDGAQRDETKEERRLRREQRRQERLRRAAAQGPSRSGGSSEDDDEKAAAKLRRKEERRSRRREQFADGV